MRVCGIEGGSRRGGSIPWFWGCFRWWEGVASLGSLAGSPLVR